MSRKASITENQAKLTTMRNNILRENHGISKNYQTSRTNNYDECIIVEKPLSFNNRSKGQSSSFIQNVEEEEIAYRNTLGAKRVHMDIGSPSMKSPLSTEENNDVSGNGFVTARAKLVSVALVKAVFLHYMFVPCQTRRDSLSSYTLLNVFLTFYFSHIRIHTIHP